MDASGESYFRPAEAEAHSYRWRPDTDSVQAQVMPVKGT